MICNYGEGTLKDYYEFLARGKILSPRGVYLLDLRFVLIE
jgi:hypothetical protein